MRTYITFGQEHKHEVDGKLFDKDCVAVIDGPDANTNRAKAFVAFGRKFCFEYPEEFWDESSMKYYPRGYIELETGNE